MKCSTWRGQEQTEWGGGNNKTAHPHIQSCWGSSLVSISAYLKPASEIRSHMVLLVALRNARDPVRFTGHMTEFSSVLSHPQEVTQIFFEKVVLTAYILHRSAASR